MIVRVVRNAQVLGLSQDVVALEGQRSFLLEQKFLNFSIQNILRLIIKVAGVTIVPVVVEVGLQGDARGLPGPVHGGPDLVVEREGIVRSLGNGVPGFVYPGAGARRDFESVAAVSYAQALHGAQRPGCVLVKLEVPIGISRKEAFVVHIPSGDIIEIVDLLGHVLTSHERGILAVAYASHLADGKVGLAQRDVGEQVQAEVERRRAVERHGIAGAVGAVPDGAGDGVLDITSVEPRIHRGEGLAVVEPEVSVEIVAEVGCQRGITETDVQRVGIVRHGKQLRHRRLVGPAAVEYAHVGILSHLPPHHGGRGISPAGIIIRLHLACAYGFVVGLGRLRGEAELGAELLQLVQYVCAEIVALVIIGDAVGIILVERPSVGVVVGILLGVRPGPGITVVGFHIPMLHYGFGISDPSEK